MSDPGMPALLAALADGEASSADMARFYGALVWAVGHVLSDVGSGDAQEAMRAVARGVLRVGAPSAPADGGEASARLDRIEASLAQVGESLSLLSTAVSRLSARAESSDGCKAVLGAVGVLDERMQSIGKGMVRLEELVSRMDAERAVPATFPGIFPDEIFSDAGGSTGEAAAVAPAPSADAQKYDSRVLRMLADLDVPTAAQSLSDAAKVREVARDLIGSSGGVTLKAIREAVVQRWPGLLEKHSSGYLGVCLAGHFAKSADGTFALREGAR